MSFFVALLIILIFVLILSGALTVVILSSLVIAVMYVIKILISSEGFQMIDDIGIRGTGTLPERVWYAGEGKHDYQFNDDDILATRNNIYVPKYGGDNWYLKDQQFGRYTEMIDEKGVKKQKQAGDKNRRAITGAVTATRNVFDRYFREELDENEQRDWYDLEASPGSELFM